MTRQAVDEMTHNITMTDGIMFCSHCGEKGTTGFSPVCAPTKVKLDATVAQENKRLSVYILISLIVLGVTVYFLHGAVTFGNTTADKLASTMSDGFTKGQDGLKSVAAAVGGRNVALIGPNSFLGEGVRRFVSGCFKFVRGILSRTG